MKISNSVELRTLRATPAKLAAIPQKLRKDIAAIQKDSRWAESYKQQQVERLRGEARREYTTLVLAARDAEQKIRKEIKAALNPAADSPEAEMARELKLSRAWARVQRSLDSGLGLIQTIQEAAEFGDLAALQAMREELPSYLRSKGQDELINRALEVLGKVEMPLLPPEQREAREVETEVNRGWPQLTATTEWIEMALNGDNGVSVVPGWEWKKTITIPQEEQ
ncbi:MAG TPA: hypothetical protein VNO70_14800 [Blastocatellia bacterium]|nr:hypothetical protein [Blastocatellia bacterium]